MPINQTDVEGDDEQGEDDMIKGDFSPQNTSASESEDSLPKRKRKSSKKSPARYGNKKEKEKLVNAIENDPTTPKTKRKYKKRATKEKQFYECEICHYKCVHQCM